MEYFDIGTGVITSESVYTYGGTPHQSLCTCLTTITSLLYPVRPQMDVGVGSFVLANAVLSREARGQPSERCAIEGTNLNPLPQPEYDSTRKSFHNACNIRHICLITSHLHIPRW
eukprot:4664406-Pyramimonas_sp.AAC.2